MVLMQVTQHPSFAAGNDAQKSKAAASYKWYARRPDHGGWPLFIPAFIDYVYISI